MKSLGVFCLVVASVHAVNYAVPMVPARVPLAPNHRSAMINPNNPSGFVPSSQGNRHRFHRIRHRPISAPAGSPGFSRRFIGTAQPLEQRERPPVRLPMARPFNLRGKPLFRIQHNKDVRKVKFSVEPPAQRRLSAAKPALPVKKPVSIPDSTKEDLVEEDDSTPVVMLDVRGLGKGIKLAKCGHRTFATTEKETSNISCCGERAFNSGNLKCEGTRIVRKFKILHRTTSTTPPTTTSTSTTTTSTSTTTTTTTAPTTTTTKEEPVQRNLGPQPLGQFRRRPMYSSYGYEPQYGSQQYGPYAYGNYGYDAYDVPQTSPDNSYPGQEQQLDLSQQVVAEKIPITLPEITPDLVKPVENLGNNAETPLEDFKMPDTSNMPLGQLNEFQRRFRNFMNSQKSGSLPQRKTDSADDYTVSLRQEFAEIPGVIEGPTRQPMLKKLGRVTKPSGDNVVPSSIAVDGLYTLRCGDQVWQTKDEPIFYGCCGVTLGDIREMSCPTTVEAPLLISYVEGDVE